MPAHAGDNYAHGHHAHEAHVHGAWELFAALDGSQLSVTVTGPIVDLLGFEHQPEAEEEHAALRTLRDRLTNSKIMFLLEYRAGCASAPSVEIIFPEGFNVKAEHDHDDHSHDRHHEHDPNAHNHDEHHHDEHNHDEHHHDEHNHDEHNHNDDQEAHDMHGSNIEVVYAFDCAHPSRLKTIRASAFEPFPAIETIDAVFLGEESRAAARLTRQSASLRVR